LAFYLPVRYHLLEAKIGVGLCRHWSIIVKVIAHKGWPCQNEPLVEGKLSFAGTFVDTHNSYEHDAGRDGAAFESLVDQFYQSLFRFAMSLTGRESDACDLVQDTFAIWAEKGWQLQQASKAKAWLFTTLHRRFLESRRRITRFPQIEINEADPELPNIEPGLTSKLDSEAVLDMLNRVDEPYRAAVALFYLEDYSYAEIAQVLDVPMGTVKSRIARGLTELKRLFSSSPSPGQVQRRPEV
jgi:RNA polymerase sigma-70 factor, ECF subfamily